MSRDLAGAARLALLSALASPAVGVAALVLGLQAGAASLWGLGGACLLQAAPSFVVWQRIREGFGNAGLERERLVLRATSFLMRSLALGVGLTSASALMGERAPVLGLPALGGTALALLLSGGLWLSKRRFAAAHPSLGLDAARFRTLMGCGAVALAGALLAQAFFRAEAMAGLALAAGLFLEGRSLAKGTALPAASCGSCGSCGCG